MRRPCVAILANVPLWTVPGLERLRHNRHYATWLEPLIPEFACCQDLDLHWVTLCKETEEDLVHHAYGQTFHILSRGSVALQMVTGFATEVFRVRKLLRRIGPLVVHAWGNEDGYGWAGALSGCGTRVFTMQGCWTELRRRGGLGRSILAQVMALYEKPSVGRYRVGTAESPGAQCLLQGLNPRMEVRVLDYGVNTEFFETEWNPEPEAELLYIGALLERKGIVDLVEMAKSPALAHIRFKVAGEGPLRQTMEKAAPSNVEWLGKCDRQALIGHLESAWGLIAPTYCDTGPTVIKEARVVGLPVITTHAAGASHYIQTAGCGFVGEPGDRAFLEASARRLCESRDAAILLGRRGWQVHRDELHPRATAIKFAELYRQMLQ